MFIFIQFILRMGEYRIQQDQVIYMYKNKYIYMYKNKIPLLPIK